jgi:hypothetical protein
MAGAGDGRGTAPAVRTLLPDGVAAALPAPAPDRRTTAAATGILLVIGAAAVGVARTRRREMAA